MRTPLSVSFAGLVVLLLSLALFLGRNPAWAAASGPAERSAVLIMVVEQQTKKNPTDQDMEVQPLLGVRDDLASYVRDTFGRGLAPSLSQEESQCVEFSCQRRLAESYQAGYVLNSGIRRNFEPGVACTITLIGIGLVSGPEPRTGSRSIPLKDSCSEAQIKQGLRRLADDVLHDQLGIPYAPPPRRPECRAPYFSRRRGIGLGIGGGITLAGLGLGAGAIANAERIEYSPPEKGYVGWFSNRSAHIGGGFGTAAAGLVIGGATMLPFERWRHGSDLPGCVPPFEGKWGFQRSLLTSFFATSLAASLIGAAGLGRYESEQVCDAIPGADPPRQAPCRIKGLLGGSLGLAGVHALGLALTIAIP